MRRLVMRENTMKKWVRMEKIRQMLRKADREPRLM